MTGFPSPPSPQALRLVCAPGRGSKAPAPPFGVGVWADSGAAVAVLLDLPKGWPGSGMGDPSAVAAQLPAAASLPHGTLVVVLGEGDSPTRLAARWLGAREKVARAVRGTALLAKGYVGIAAGVDEATGQDLVWGWSPQPSGPTSPSQAP